MIQWFLLATVVLGLGWSLMSLLFIWVGFLAPAIPGDRGGMNILALLIIEGAGGGLLFSFLSRGLTTTGERSGIRRVTRRLRGAAGEMTRGHIVAPPTAKLERLAEARRLIRGLRA